MAGNHGRDLWVSTHLLLVSGGELQALDHQQPQDLQ